MTRRIIGVMGRKRSGKDTFAGRLVSDHDFTRIAFADPLKATMLDLDPYVIDPTWTHVRPDGPPHVRLSAAVKRLGWEGAKEWPEVRRLLQAHGVAIREHVDPEAWVNAAIAKMTDPSGRYVVTDVRFPNEAAALRRLGAVLVRVDRPGLEEDAASLHISETALDDFVPTFRVFNGGTLDDLYARADEIAEVTFLT